MTTPTNSSNSRRREGGFALLLALIISSVVLAIGLTLLAVALKQLNLSATSRESEVAFQMANLGMECGRYWRDELAELLFDTSSNNSDFLSAGISCVGVTPVTLDFDALTDTDPRDPGPDGQQNVLTFQFDIMVGNEARCVNVDVNVIDASDDIVDHLVGRVETDCDEDDVCTVIISQGYNRSCAQVESSFFSVQRELTAEF